MAGPQVGGGGTWSAPNQAQQVPPMPAAAGQGLDHAASKWTTGQSEPETGVAARKPSAASATPARRQRGTVTVQGWRRRF